MRNQPVALGHLRAGLRGQSLGRIEDAIDADSWHLIHSLSTGDQLWSNFRSIEI
jgi:hypothetical protein